MPTFDVVSKVDFAEVDNALANLAREIEQRYDFKGSRSSVARQEQVLVIEADDDLKLKQIHEILKGHMTRRSIAPEALDFGTVEQAAGQSVRQSVTVRNGIDSATAKKIVKAIKDRKMKVQAAIQGDTVRVTGKKRDDLQDVIAMLKAYDAGLPLQYENFRD
ncbi:MAG: YajQ family cyclic di-GMP-binding protein [Pseudomonadota bacterium]